MLIDRSLYLKRVMYSFSISIYIVKKAIIRGPKLITKIYNDDIFYDVNPHTAVVDLFRDH